MGFRYKQPFVNIMLHGWLMLVFTVEKNSGWKKIDFVEKKKIHHFFVVILVF